MCSASTRACFTPNSGHCSPGLTIRPKTSGNSKKVWWRTQPNANRPLLAYALLTGERTANSSIYEWRYSLNLAIYANDVAHIERTSLPVRIGKQHIGMEFSKREQRI